MAHVLVVDDQGRFRHSLKLLLQSEGHSADEAEDSPSGIELASRGCYDVIITDLYMKRGSGLELLAAPASRRAKVIVVTGLPSEETREAAANLGAFAYLEKPLDIEYLLRAIDGAATSGRDGVALGRAGAAFGRDSARDAGRGVAAAGSVPSPERTGSVHAFAVRRR